MLKPEILAPAGSYNAFISAVNSGCDAVYLGGENYGARAYAKNFDIETLTRAVEYARLFKVKIYYTLNVLFKEKEIEELIKHIDVIRCLGIDAVIVQDIGVLSMLNTLFPELELHASTQMNCHSIYGIKFLEKLGVKQVVLARELSLIEIKHIKSKTDMKIETFVHGALCYCYSGQCLMSSFMGGRSGNRGRCAQPCRLKYKVIIDEQVVGNNHMLSPKDIETLTVLPLLIEAGIDSFKIEGRMKSPEYALLITRLYRFYRDEYIKNGHIKVLQEDLNDMLQIFNRGSFSNGYFFEHNGDAMMTIDQPKNQGRVIGTVRSKSKQYYILSIFEEVRKGDCLEIKLSKEQYYSWIVQNDVIGDYSIKSDKVLKVGQEVRRIKSIELDERLKALQNVVKKESINIKVTMSVNASIIMDIWDKNRAITVEGDMVQEAKNQGLTHERVLKQFLKVDKYPIVIEDIGVSIDENVFMSMGQLNALRRLGFDRWLGIESQKIIKKMKIPSIKPIKNMINHHRNITVLLRNVYQFDIIKRYSIEKVYIEWFNFSVEEIDRITTYYKDSDTDVYLAVPKILRYEKEDIIKVYMDSVSDDIDGFLVRSIDGYMRVSCFGRSIIWDTSMSVMNQHTANYLMAKQGAVNYCPSLELNRGELKGLPLNTAEYIVYGYLNTMTSAQCVRKTVNGCIKEQGKVIYLNDRKNMSIPVETVCNLCYNNIYNAVPHYLIDKMDELMAIGMASFRLEFLDEDPELIERIMKAVMLNIKSKANDQMNHFTRGHYNKGVE